MIKNQFDPNIKVFRIENDKEYLENKFQKYVDDNRILRQTTSVYYPQQNGIAERKNRHLMEVARSLMFATNVPKYF